jgi:ADP-ribose pyrophosphatase YjhB (NUDIX family)
MTADIIVFAKQADTYRVLLVTRKGHPFIRKLALPGGFAHETETINETAARELAEETGVEHLQLNLVGLYSNPGRDPRGWVVSAAFAAVVDADLITVRAGDDAAQAGWFTVDGENLICGEESCRFEELAFDHGKILRDALRFLLRSR